MVRNAFRPMFAAAALAAGLALAAPAAAQETGYAIIGASQARVNYSYLTREAVTAKLSKAVAAKLPADGRLVILNVRSLGNPSKMVRLDPGELQLQWDGGGTAPVLGAHIAKEFWAMGGSGFYTSMRPDKYELFAVVPAEVRSVDLAHRQPDGSYRVVKAKIGLSAARR